MKRINIAIDGPAGAGKSTIAKAISRILGIIYLDTGAMYRAVALKAINSGIDTKDSDALTELVKSINIRIDYKDNQQQVYLDDENVTDKIRTQEVSVGASNVAAVPLVRIKMVELQREIANNNSVVMDGRDIGTYVLPNARYKFFLTASIEERVKRRYLEQLDKVEKDISFEEVKRDIVYRDKNDSSRDFAPLCKADDAVEIDTTGMSIEDVINRIVSIINKGHL